MIRIRPIVVRSSFGHTTLANARAIELAGVSASTPDPENGKIARDGAGNPTGLFEDAAQRRFDALLPAPTQDELVAGARRALDAFRREGITTFLDASAAPEQIAAFAAVRKEGTLSARVHAAPVITAESFVEWQKTVPLIHASPDVKRAAVRYVDGLRRSVSNGHAVSPRATIAWLRAAQARAILARREFVTVEDLLDIAPEVFRHRLWISPPEIRDRLRAMGVR